MKKRNWIFWILVLAMLLQMLSVPAFAEGETEPTGEDTQQTVPTTPEHLPTYAGEDASVAAGSRTIEAMSSLQGDQQLLKTAASAVLYEINSDSMVYSWNPDERMAPCGLTMVVSALVALKHCTLDETVTVSGSAFDSIDRFNNTADTYRYHTMVLQNGEQLRVKDLLYGMIVWNANDAAAALAEHVSGNQNSFVNEMNEFVRELGCTNTNFVNVHGMDASGQYTTARDMARIMTAASTNTDFIRIAYEDFWDVNETNLYPYRAFMYSDNYMCGMLIYDLYYEFKVIGGKVAENADGRRSYACLAKSGDLYYAIIVMETTPDRSEDGSIKKGGHNEFVETQQLIDIAFDGYAIRQVLRPGQITTRFDVNNGTNDVVAGPTTATVTLLPDDIDLDDLTLRYLKTNGTLNAPVDSGVVIDTIQVWYGSVCVAQSDLITMNTSRVSTLQRPDTPSEKDPQKGSVGLTVFFVIVGVLVAAAAGLYIVRVMRINAFKKRMMRRRKSRRRN